MSGRGIVESGVFRSEQVSRLARTSDPSSPAKGDAWIRTDVQPVTDSVAALRIQGDSGYLEAPLFDPSVTTGADVYVGKRFLFADGTEGHLLVTDQVGAVGSPRIVTSSGTLYETHDALEVIAIPDSGVFRYDFEDTADVTTIVDSWHSNNATTSGGPSYTSDSAVNSYALSLDGSDDRVEGIPRQQDGFPKTLSAWVYLRAFKGYPSVLADDLATNGNYTGLAIQINDDGSVAGVVGDNTGNTTSNQWTFATDGTLSALQYTLVTAAFGGIGDVDIYFNDASKSGSASGSASSVGYDNTTGVIGHRDAGDHWLDAIVDDPRVYTKKLTAGEVSNLYNTGSISG